VNDRRDLSPDVDFSAAANIGAHDRADEMEEKPSLDLLRRLEPIEAGLMEPKAQTGMPNDRSIHHVVCTSRRP
jgi:hypothetical protein